MVCAKVESVRIALAALAGQVGSGEWEFIFNCRRELDDARDMTAVMEVALYVPRCDPEEEGLCR